jgi:hypothetical protein
MRRTTTLVALAAVAGMLLGASAASADTQQATSGAVAATLSYQLGDSGLGATGMRLAVTRAGAPAYDEPVDPKGCTGGTCAPYTVGGSALRVADLDADGEPEVLADVYTGGAHCCEVTRILRWTGTAYHVIDHDWADPGYKLEDVDHDGRPELVTADARFAFRYGSFASSAFPVVVLVLRDGHLVDRTRSYRSLIRKDRARQLRLARGEARRTPRGAYAAWAADRYRLGERAATLRSLRRLAARGRLRTDIGSNSRAAQRRWVHRLDRDLRRLGYTR